MRSLGLVGFPSSVSYPEPTYPVLVCLPIEYIPFIKAEFSPCTPFWTLETFCALSCIMYSVRIGDGTMLQTPKELLPHCRR